MNLAREQSVPCNCGMSASAHDTDVRTNRRYCCPGSIIFDLPALYFSSQTFVRWTLIATSELQTALSANFNISITCIPSHQPSPAAPRPRVAAGPFLSNKTPWWWVSGAVVVPLSLSTAFSSRPTSGQSHRIPPRASWFPRASPSRAYYRQDGGPTAAHRPLRKSPCPAAPAIVPFTCTNLLWQQGIMAVA